MKIIYVEDCFNPTALYQINEILKQSHGKFEKVLITSDDLTPFHKEYSEKEDLEFSNKYSVKIIRIPMIFHRSGRRWLKGLYKEIEKNSPDIVFMHGIGDLKDPINLLKKNKYLLFRDCHMSWSATTHKNANLFYSLFKTFIGNFINLFQKYDKIYSLGIEETQYLNALGIENKYIEEFPHGYNKVDYHYSQNERENFRKEISVEDNEILIGYIGKFDNAKQPQINLEIINLLGKEYILENKIKFLFLGPQEKKYMDEVFNPLLENIEEEIKPIILPGRRADELREVYNGIDICLWPKQTTLSSVHAQVCHTTVVMEDETSNKERVVENDNLYMKNDLEDAIKKLKNIIENKKYLKEKNSWYVEKLKNREYSYQMEQKIKEWEELVEKKRKSI